MNISSRETFRQYTLADFFLSVYACIFTCMCISICIKYILCIYTQIDVYVAGREGAVLAAQAVLRPWTPGAEGSAWPALVFTAGLLVVAGRVCH